MDDQHKTKEQLVAELAEMRRRVAELEASETELKRVEGVLRESEEQYRSFVQDFPGIAYRGRVDFTVLFFHGAVEQITGYSEHDFTSGKITWDQVICRDDFAGIQESVEKVHSVPDYSTEREYRVLRKDGDTRWVHEVIHNICDGSGKPAYVQGVIHDITDRKRAEQALREAHDQLERRVRDRTAELREAGQRLQREIDERKASQVSLQESEERYRTLVEASPDAIIMTDTEGRITFASEKVLQLHGSEHLDEVYNRNPLEFLAPEDHERFQANLRVLLKEGTRRNDEYTLVRKDGTCYVAEMSAAVIRGSSGNPQALMSLIRDVTERKRAAEELEQSHDQLRAIYDGMADGLVVVDIETQRFRRVNPAMCRMVGYTEDELLTMTVMDIHPPDTLSRASEDFKTLAQGRQVTVHGIPVLRKDGTLVYADICGSFVTYDGRPCTTGFFHDVTQRKQTEEALRQSHDQLQAIYSGMFDGLLVADIETKRFLRTNPAICRMLGYSEDELLALSVTDIHPPEDVPKVMETFKAQAEGRLIVAEDMPVLRKDGSVFYVDITTNPINYLGRRCSMGVFHDITARKQAEESLQGSIVFSGRC